MNNQQTNISFSICIPVYNKDVSELVTSLHQQAIMLNVPFEIQLVDDASLDVFRKKNRLLESFSHIFYTQLPENIGRSAIRNLLTAKAKYPYLIFMDCDAKVEDEHFIENYLNEIPADVVVGGCGYYPTPPDDEKLILRWKYGICREARPATKRNQEPSKSFSAFNVLIRKDVVQQINFNDNISGYGHEDTLFGWNLKKQGVLIKHIDNAAMHLGLEDADCFISKTIQSIQNLWKIYQNIPENEKKKFVQNIHLLKYYTKLQKYFLTSLLSFFFYLFQPLLLKNLRSNHPNIKIFDLYKLGILNRFVKQKKM